MVVHYFATIKSWIFARGWMKVLISGHDWSFQLGSMLFPVQFFSKQSIAIIFLQLHKLRVLQARKRT